MTFPPSIFQVGHLERVPLGTPYPGIVAHVGRLLDKLPAGTELVIDLTGVGRPVFDMFVYSGISPLGVLITAGASETRDGPICGVPKADARFSTAGLAARKPAKDPARTRGCRNPGARTAGFSG